MVFCCCFVVFFFQLPHLVSATLIMGGKEAEPSGFQSLLAGLTLHRAKDFLQLGGAEREQTVSLTGHTHK